MEVKNNRFVVFLDIMGFKDRVARNSADELYKELTDFNRDITTIINSSLIVNRRQETKQEESSEAKLISNKDFEDNILLAQFSDSIVLFSSDNSEKSLQTITNVTVKIMQKAINREKPIPLKGALAEGQITCDMSKQLFFGQSLIDAYLLEENVQFYGIAVHHTAEGSVKAINSEWYKNAKIPLKSGIIEHFMLVWWTREKESVSLGLDRLRLMVSDTPRKYVDNTRDLVNKVWA